MASVQNRIDSGLFKEPELKGDELVRRLSRLVDDLKVTLDEIQAVATSYEAYKEAGFSGALSTIDTEGKTITYLLEKGKITGIKPSTP